MLEMIIACNKSEEICELLKNVHDPIIFSSIIGTVIDQWAADNKLSHTIPWDYIHHLYTITDEVNAEQGELSPHTYS